MNQASLSSGSRLGAEAAQARFGGQRLIACAFGCGLNEYDAAECQGQAMSATSASAAHRRA